ACYQADREQDLQSLESSWQRVARHLPASARRPQTLEHPSHAEVLLFRTKRTRTMDNNFSEPSESNMQTLPPAQRKPVRGRLWRRLSVSAAILVAAVLVGSAGVVLNLRNQTRNTVTASR